MKTRKLGNLTVSALGLGCMGMSAIYGKSDDEESIKVLHHAIDSGITLFDTADMYGQGHNEKLVGNALKSVRNKIVIASKFGIVGDRDNRSIDASPSYARACCAASLKRLNTDYIDLYYLHRFDPKVPIEETVAALAGLVQEGKIRHIGLSEISADILRRAHAVHPITAIQSEYSLMSRQVESNGILETCHELDIGFVAYSPLSRALLSSEFKGVSDSDIRKHLPRFQGEALDKNQRLVQQIESIAIKYEATSAQIALAWLLAQKDYIVPIPGTRRNHYLNDNCAAVDITLEAADIELLNHIFKLDNIQGARYSEQLMKTYNIQDKGDPK